MGAKLRLLAACFTCLPWSSRAISLFKLHGSSVDEDHASSYEGPEKLYAQASSGAKLEWRAPSFARGPQNDRQKAIVEMMRHTWDEGYEKYCFGKDTLRPVSSTCGMGWNLGLTLIDSLDTLYLMGMDTEFKRARDWVADPKLLDFGQVDNKNLFETTIRVLGGLLGAYTLSGDQVFLNRALDLGQRLSPALKGRNGLPFSDIDPSTGYAQFLGGSTASAEATSLGLEFTTLSRATGIQEFERAIAKIGRAFHRLHKKDGLIATWLNPDNPNSDSGSHYTIGARTDSYYEYLLKEWLLTGKTDSTKLDDYKQAVKGAQMHLIHQSKGPLNLTYLGSIPGRYHMDHLSCFFPGTLALGAMIGIEREEHLDLAKRLVRTCVEMYKATGNFLGPESVLLDSGSGDIAVDGSDDVLRPETIESLFYLYRATGDKQYQDWGWEIAKALNNFAKRSHGGYSSVNSVSKFKLDDMESFFPAETLKYLFLLFDDSRAQVPLDEYVFNTEAHPLRILGPRPM